jgi:Family of unknown function (DUF5994)
MSAPPSSFATTQARRWTIAHPRLRLKPTHGSAGFVQGGWWPRTDQLHTELRVLLAALSSRSGTVERVIYDENSWASVSLRMEFRGHSVVLESSNTSANTLTVSGKQFGTLVLLVVPPDTDPAAAHTAVVTAADPDDVSTAEELLAIAARAAQEGRHASTRYQHCESDRQELRRWGCERGECAHPHPGAAVSRRTAACPDPPQMPDDAHGLQLTTYIEGQPFHLNQ